MDSAMISRIIAVVPERSSRAHRGTPFDPSQAGPQLAGLARFLGWLSPLQALTREDQAALGHAVPQARPALREDEELDSEESSLIGD